MKSCTVYPDATAVLRSILLFLDLAKKHAFSVVLKARKLEIQVGLNFALY